MKSKRQPHFIKTLFFSYAVLALLPCLVGLSSYHVTSKIVRDDIRRANISLLAACAEDMDRRLEEIDRITSQIASAPQVSRLRSLDAVDASHGFYYYLWETTHFLSNYSLYDRSGTEYLLYFKNSNMLVDTHGAYSFDSYYHAFGYPAYSEDTFLNQILSVPTAGRLLPSQDVQRLNLSLQGCEHYTLPVLTYLKSMPVGKRGVQNGMILVQIREDVVLNALSRIETGEGGGVCVLDSAGNVITSTGEDISSAALSLTDKEGFIEYTLDGTPMYLTYTVSAYNGWTYFAATPASITMAKASDIRNLCLFYTLFALLLGFALLAALTYANSIPLLEIKNRLLPYASGVQPRHGELYALSRGVDNLITRADTAESEAAARREVLLRTLLLSLTRAAPDHLSDTASAAGLSFDADSYVWMVSPCFAETHRGVESVSLSAPHARAYFLRVENRQLAALVFLYHTDEQTVETIALQLSRQTDAPVGIGKRCTNIQELPASFATARRALGVGRKDGSPLLRRYDEDGGNCYYPVELELRLMNIVRSGNVFDLHTITAELRGANAEPMTLDARRRLRAALTVTLNRLGIPHTETAGDDANPDVYDLLADAEADEPVPACFSRALEELCEDFAAQKRRLARAFSANVAAWLRENYTDPNMSLSLAASYWKRSESTIAQMIRDETGDTFLGYLERLRLEEASRLLAASDARVTDIAVRVGYASPQSFRRAFKRVTGFSPSAYTGVVMTEDMEGKQPSKQSGVSI